MNNSMTRMAMIVPNTPKHWITKAVVHCFIFPPSSRGSVAIQGGAIRYSSSRLKIRATQLIMMTA